MMNFKIKQKLTLVLALVILFCSLSSLPALANKSGTIRSKDLDVSIAGWVDFVRGPFPVITPDLLWYNASASGSQLWMVANTPSVGIWCYVNGGSDKVTLPIRYLNDNNRFVSESSVKVGNGAHATYGYLRMVCIYDSMTITVR